MQYPIADPHAVDLAARMYAELAVGRTIAEALNETRVAMSIGGRPWGTPVLYLNGEDAALLASPASPPPQEPVSQADAKLQQEPTNVSASGHAHEGQTPPFRPGEAPPTNKFRVVLAALVACIVGLITAWMIVHWPPPFTGPELDVTPPTGRPDVMQSDVHVDVPGDRPVPTDDRPLNPGCSMGSVVRKPWKRREAPRRILEFAGQDRCPINGTYTLNHQDGGRWSLSLNGLLVWPTGGSACRYTLTRNDREIRIAALSQIDPSQPTDSRLCAAELAGTYTFPNCFYSNSRYEPSCPPGTDAVSTGFEPPQEGCRTVYTCR